MSYSLNNISQIDGLLFDGENRSQLAKSLNLKHNVWKHKNGINYHILKYDKEWLSRDTVSSTGLLRSLIFKEDGTVVCFAPPKSYNSDDLTIDSNMEYRAEKFIEGTMINVFYEKDSETWEIATRSSVGGEMCFFMENGFQECDTFKYMFNEVCEHIDLNLNDLNKDYIYSFVMQHPRNRIVKIIKEMRLYLTDVYQVVENKTINIIPITDMNKFGIKENTVLSVQVNPVKNIEELELCKKTAASANTNYSTVGVIIKNNLGHRYKFRNPNYEHVRRLRGNQPKLQFQYLNLRQAPKEEDKTESKLTEYLKYYPEHKTMFNEFRTIVHQYTSGLFTNYISCYIKKEKELKTFPEKYRTHMYNLHHDIYLKEMAPEKKLYITKLVVINYFNNLHPAKQMYVLNYDVRKNYIAKEKFDNSNPVESVKNITDESQ
jgi:hypothetical protein